MSLILINEIYKVYKCPNPINCRLHCDTCHEQAFYLWDNPFILYSNNSKNLICIKCLGKKHTELVINIYSDTESEPENEPESQVL